jgi:hypothetical protein
MKSWRPHRLACLLLVLLFLAGALQVADASMRILCRYTVLSWDNPATQHFDELICESSPPSQAGVEAGLSTRLAVRASRPPVADSTASRPPSPALSSGITRSPPAA